MTVAVDHNGLHGGAAPPSSAGQNTSGSYAKVDPSLPQVFGRYLLVQRLSRGGMGEIFIAKHGLSGFEKLCVIKKVLPHLAEDESFISRFVDEAQVAIKLQHVNVAAVFEVGRVGDEYFLAIEYVEGRDLRRTLQVLGRQRRRFPPDLALFVARELSNGLAYAHRRVSADGSSLGLVHCDISPPNVLVSFEGETKVIDFGIAKSALRATATDPKMGFGKFGYMAPEQLIRGGVVDHRTDIYATGVLLYELLTGERLYELGESPDYRALARAVSRGEHKVPSDLDPMLAPFDLLVAKALRPKVEDRFQTAAEYRDAIQTALVQVNPTISSDHLGAFLRDVFKDEMHSHQELVDRVAHMHLDDFREALTTQSVETVSFALANMPLVAPSEQPPAGRRDQQRTAIAGMVHADTPTGTVELSDRDLVPDHTLDARRRPQRWPVIAATAVAVVAVILVIVLSTRDSGSKAAPPAPIADRGAVMVDAGQGATVTSIPPDAAVAIELAPDAAPAAVKPVKKPIDKVVKKVPDKDKVDKPKDPAPALEVDTAAVLAKFKTVSREYRDFKTKFGSRLDDDWTELATKAQYAKSPAQLTQLDRKLDHFRSLMRSAQ
jgi:serine/threonine protein kinase